ncbi:MAG: alpha/beta hydrolase [Pseudomonadota bacterium]
MRQSVGVGFRRTPPVGTSRRFFLAQGLYLHCVEAGEGEPLVMVHGLGGSWDNWLPIIPSLSRRYRCLVPDLPGFGLSPKPDAPYTVAWFAEVLRDMLRGAGALPAVLAGNSLGGHICLEYALRWPQEVKALVLSAPAGTYRAVPPRNRMLLGLFQFFGLTPLARRFGPFFARFFVERLFYRCGPECRDKIDFYGRYLADPEYPLFWRAACRAARDHLRRSLHDRLCHIDQATLIVAGRHDPVIPLPELTEAARLIPRARLTVFEECAHLPQVEWPERFAAEVEGFLGGRAG